MRVSADHKGKEQMEKRISIAARGCIVANTLKDAVKRSINPVSFLSEYF
jgi:hypothetical protein